MACTLISAVPVSVVIAIHRQSSVCVDGRTHDNSHNSAVLGAGRTPDVMQPARMQVRLDTGHVLPVSQC